ncbi:MAG: hypothetical protein HZB26_10905 [Candidatus Hydrogenedentes bacterium]|nr:hypothetical protein [Candidatus Hydrogenedentota bacterium]
MSDVDPSDIALWPGMPRRAADLERDAAAALGGRRVIRQDLFETAVDVRIPDFPDLSVDCKYRKTLAHHKLMKTTRQKYGGTPLLVTRTKEEGETFATLPLKVLGHLLDIARAAGQTKLDGDGRITDQAGLLLLGRHDAPRRAREI